MAGHRRGRTCWRSTSRQRRCWDICGADQAGRTSTASQQHSNGRATGQPRPCAFCELRPMSATLWSSAAGAWATSDLAAFSEHLRTCRCPRAKGGRRNHHTIYGARLFRRHLVESGVCLPADTAAAHVEPQLVADFKAWLRKHRGASEATIRLYARDAVGMLTALAADPTGSRPSTGKRTCRRKRPSTGPHSGHRWRNAMHG